MTKCVFPIKIELLLLESTQLTCIIGVEGKRLKVVGIHLNFLCENPSVGVGRIILDNDRLVLSTP